MVMFSVARQQEGDRLARRASSGQAALSDTSVDPTLKSIHLSSLAAIALIIIGLVPVCAQAQESRRAYRIGVLNEA